MQNDMQAKLTCKVLKLNKRFKVEIEEISNNSAISIDTILAQSLLVASEKF